MSDEGIFLGYSMHSKAFSVFNKRTLTVEESVHVIFDESPKGDRVLVEKCAGNIEFNVENSEKAEEQQNQQQDNDVQEAEIDESQQTQEVS